MALLLLEKFGFEKRAHVDAGGEAVAKTIVERSGTGEQALFEQAGANRDVVRHLGLAFLDGAYRMRDFQTGIPEHADEAFDRRRTGARFEGPGQQDQDVDVGVGEELAPTIASYGDQRSARQRADLEPQPPHDTVDQRRMPRQQPLGWGIGRESAFQRGASGDELTLPVADSRIRGSRWRSGKRRDHADCQACATAGAGGVPSETVNTS